jgi:hypothetical protein
MYVYVFHVNDSVMIENQLVVYMVVVWVTKPIEWELGKSMVQSRWSHGNREGLDSIMGSFYPNQG